MPASLAMALANFAATADAQPAPPPCDFRLSDPRVVQMSSASMVTVMVGPGPCHVAATPHLSVACLQIQGNDSAPQVRQHRGAG